MTLGVMALQKEHVPTTADAIEEQGPLRITTPTPSTPTSTPAAAPANSPSSSSLPSESLPSEFHEPDVSSPPEPAEPPRTVTTALALLRSLQPQISAILDGSSGVQVPLEVLDVLKTTRITAPRARRDPNAVTLHASDAHAATPHGSDPPFAEDDQSTSDNHLEPVQESEHVEKVGAGVLFVGPKHVARAEEDDERRKLREVSGAFYPAPFPFPCLIVIFDGCLSELIHRAFKDAGYITEQRPLKVRPPAHTLHPSVVIL
jgi:hypothetical protein